MLTCRPEVRSPWAVAFSEVTNRMLELVSIDSCSAELILYENILASSVIAQQRDSSDMRICGKQGSFNSLAPGKFEWKFRYVIFKQILVIDGQGISCEIALRRMSIGLMISQHWLR